MNTPNKQAELEEGISNKQFQKNIDKAKKDILENLWDKGYEQGKAQALAEKGLVKLDDVMKIIDELPEELGTFKADPNDSGEWSEGYDDGSEDTIKSIKSKLKSLEHKT